MKRIAIIFVICSLFGCTHLQPKQTYNILITSEPKGANIEINGNYIGKAPLTVSYESRGGAFEDRAYTFRAFPKKNGHCTQVKSFNGGYSLSQYNDKIPEQIFFDMKICPNSKNLMDKETEKRIDQINKLLLFRHLTQH